MRFSTDDNTIESSLSEEELEDAWRKQIERSEAWKRHAETHQGANLVGFSSSSPLEEGQAQKKENIPVVKYDAETGKFPTATCNCGMHFELHQDSGVVYRSGEIRSESIAGPYLESKGTPQVGSIYDRNESKGQPPSRFFSYKN